MSALAELLHRMGAKVTGSDIKESVQTKRLGEMGVIIFPTHEPQNITDDDVVVYSSAIDNENPEIKEAKLKQIPIIPRAEALAEIMRYKRGIAIGGTHGKTTTTSMLASIFLKSELEPTIAVGGRLKLIESTARLGNGEWMVAEADESDGSFSRLNPEISVITNIDEDHLDHFKSFENLQAAFKDFALKIPFYGTAIVNGDDPRTRELFSDFTKRILYFGAKDDNDFYLKKSNNLYQVYFRGENIGGFLLKVPGMHNAMNALAACIAAHQAGVSWEKCFAGVNAYTGVDRRFQLIGEESGVSVYDDYAHHPTEIQATLQAASDEFQGHKVHVIFQPHRYSRTKDCWKQFKTSFHNADSVRILDIYPAGEAPIKGITSQNLVSLMGDNIYYSESFEQAVTDVVKESSAGDVIMTIGAGNVWECASMAVKNLKGEK